MFNQELAGSLTVVFHTDLVASEGTHNPSTEKPPVAHAAEPKGAHIDEPGTLGKFNSPTGSSLKMVLEVSHASASRWANSQVVCAVREHEIGPPGATGLRRQEAVALDALRFTAGLKRTQPKTDIVFHPAGTKRLIRLLILNCAFHPQQHNRLLTSGDSGSFLCSRQTCGGAADEMDYRQQHSAELEHGAREIVSVLGLTMWHTKARLHSLLSIVKL
jgi:hypothetical protein